MRTAKRLRVATIAVYSEADAGALHVAMADEARLIGPPPARQSYLNAEAIIVAAKETGAEAIHPGYGFLSENADFAEACGAAGIVFIGPPPAAMRAMGSKAAAKALMQSAGVPVVAGYHGDEQEASRLLAEAERIGFPVLIKASGGGGGRGMRIVKEAVEFTRALDGAKREALSAFGDDRVLIEKYLTSPRHIEVQVFADTHGNVLHLYERDCSIQRRYQKIVEEAPAPGLNPDMRQAMGEAAVAAAQTVGYVGAGTVEFIAEGNAFYFMEMNTRLQVEHPVTEAVTGTDLVEWQLRVAAGERFTRTQKDITLSGHAIEVRLYAENPERGFLPATGTLHRLRLPTATARVETGVREGDAVTPFYDPMIAKIIAWGRDRKAARLRLARALAETGILGLATNLSFLARIIGDADFAAARLDTGFIERRRAALLPPAAPAPHQAVAAAALFCLREPEGDASDPWARRDGWRLNAANAPRTLVLRDGEDASAVTATATGAAWTLAIGDGLYQARGRFASDGAAALTLDGGQFRAVVLDHGDDIAVFMEGAGWRFVRVDPLAPPAGADVHAGRLSAPMPGRVVQLLVAAGDRVSQGQPLIVIEAMKMEHTIAAPRDGKIAAVRYAMGDFVEEGAELVTLEDA